MSDIHLSNMLTCHWWQAKCLQDCTSRNPAPQRFGSGRLGKQLLLRMPLLKSPNLFPGVNWA